MRGALAGLLTVLACGAWTGPAAAECAIASARYAAPTDRYPHGVLGDRLEWSELHVRLAGGGCRAAAEARRLPQDLVFEDVAPRLADLDADGAPEIIVVESHRDQGARLAIWGLRGGRFERVAATPFIGRRFRWLAPVGAADLDGDGAVEIAYVDRPHLAGILRVWRYETSGLREVATMPGHSNHRIGQREISGGIRHCGDGPEMITASLDWTRIRATRLLGGRLISRDLGPVRTSRALAAAIACR